MLQGAVAVSGREVGLVFGATERVSVPAERLGELLQLPTLTAEYSGGVQGIGMAEGPRARALS